MAVLLNDKTVWVVFVDGLPHLFLRMDNAMEYANACQVQEEEEQDEYGLDYEIVEGPYEIGFDDWPK